MKRGCGDRIWVDVFNMGGERMIGVVRCKEDVCMETMCV